MLALRSRSCLGQFRCHRYACCWAGASCQCFPFYTYDADGGHRRDNVTDWALEQFKTRYPKAGVTKRDIFHYVYAVLHHSEYRKKYAANLRRELPRIPFAPDFAAFAETGRKLAELHIGYESQKEYPLKRVETPGARLDLRVERMKLSKDKTALAYNSYLTLQWHPARSLRVPARQPVGAGMGDRPIPRRTGQDRPGEDRQRPEPLRRRGLHPPPCRPGRHCQRRDGEARPRSRKTPLAASFQLKSHPSQRTNRNGATRRPSSTLRTSISQTKTRLKTDGSKAYSISTPTGQWSLPRTSGEIQARFRRGRSADEITK